MNKLHEFFTRKPDIGLTIDDQYIVIQTCVLTPLGETRKTVKIKLVQCDTSSQSIVNIATDVRNKDSYPWDEFTVFMYFPDSPTNARANYTAVFDRCLKLVIQSDHFKLQDGEVILKEKK